jgi:hypothetical protein
MAENVDLICVWSHAVSVGIYMVEQHAGVQI